MKIELEGKKSLTCLIPGLYQFGPNESFTPCVLALSDKSLIIYNDFGPDEIRQNAFLYRIKKEVQLEELKSVVRQKIKRDSDIKQYDRLSVIHKTIEECFFIYYLKEDKALVKKMLKKMKEAGVNVKKMSISLASNA